MKYADEFNSRGVQEYQKGNFITAIKCFKKAIDMNKTYLDAYLNLAVTYSDTGLSEDASKVYTKLNALDPYYIQKYGINVEKRSNEIEEIVDLGNMFLREQKFSDAVAMFRKAVNKHPNYADLWNYLGESYLFIYDITKATKAFKEALMINPDYKLAKKNLSLCYYKEGMKSLKQGLKKEAFRNFVDSIEIDTENSKARLHLNILKKEYVLEIPCNLCGKLLDLDWNYCPYCGVEK